LGDIIGIAGAVAVILAGLGVFVAMALRRKRAIDAGGYVEIERAEDAIAEVTGTLFDLAPAEVHRKEGPSGPSWLVFVDTGDSESSGCAMLVYRVGHDDWPAVAVVRSGRRIPGVLRRLSGGFLARAEPMAGPEAGGFAGTGWFAYQAPGKEVPEALKARLFEAARPLRADGLLGIAVIQSHLAVWSDADRLQTLLAKAPLVHAAFRNSNRNA
jgi:hypothetical protein